MTVMDVQQFWDILPQSYDIEISKAAIRKAQPVIANGSDGHFCTEQPYVVSYSAFCNRTFDGVLARGLMFLLSSEDQRRLIKRIASILLPGGRVLFTSCVEPLVCTDAMTGLESRSLEAHHHTLGRNRLWRDHSDAFSSE